MPRRATPPCTTRALRGQLCPQVSGCGGKPPQVFIDAQALLLKLVEHLIEPQLCVVHAPVSLPKELVRRGEDSNLRRQAAAQVRHRTRRAARGVRRRVAVHGLESRRRLQGQLLT